MELLVHASTSGHLLVVCSLELTIRADEFGTEEINVRVMLATPTAHLLLWAMTIFVRVHGRRILGGVHIASYQTLSGMARFVRVVAHAAGSTIHHGSPRT